MALPMIYSRRKRLREKTGEDVYQYTEISEKLRTQIWFILMEMAKAVSARVELYQWSTVIASALRKEYGQQSLGRQTGPHGDRETNELYSFLYSENEITKLIDFIEISVIECLVISDCYPIYHNKIMSSIEELNARMLEDGFGFQFENKQMIEIGSQFIHKEVTVPALGLLSDAKYDSANDEFRAAHDAYKSRDYENCIIQCGKAFESVLKVIAAEKGWDEKLQKATANSLIEAAKNNGLFPPYIQEGMNGLTQLLKGGIPAIRNNEGGHGAGNTDRNVPKHLAAFQLHQTAAAIVFLVDSAAD